MTSPSYDVAVVGLGAMGAATLYQLSLRGVKVVGLDRYRPPHAHGSSHGESRVTRQSVGEGAAYVPLVLRTHEIWRELERESGRSILAATGFLLLRRQGHTCVHGQADFLGATADLARQFGIAHELLDANAIARRFPHFTDLDGSTGYYEPGGGYVIPEAAIVAQLELAERRGAAIKTGAAVTRIKPERDHVVIETGSGTFRAGQAVIAAGGWIRELLGAPYDKLLRIERQVFHWFPVAPAYPDPQQNPVRHPVFIWLHAGADVGHFYGFPPAPGAREVKLATEHPNSASNADSIDWSTRPEESAAFFEHHVKGRLAHVLPQAVRRQVCFYTLTPNNDFLIDRHPDSERVMVISACSGHGFKHSAAIGEAVAEQMVSGRSRIPLAPFALSRFLHT